MKTAVSIPDDIFEKVKRLVAKRGKRTRNDVFSAALREYVVRYSRKWLPKRWTGSAPKLAPSRMSSLPPPANGGIHFHCYSGTRPQIRSSEGALEVLVIDHVEKLNWTDCRLDHWRTTYVLPAALSGKARAMPAHCHFVPDTFDADAGLDPPEAFEVVILLFQPFWNVSSPVAYLSCQCMQDSADWKFFDTRSHVWRR
jgi:hypothetical protein